MRECVVEPFEGMWQSVDMLNAVARPRQRGLPRFCLAVALAVTALASPGFAAAAQRGPAQGSPDGGWHVAARIQVARHSVIVTAIDAVSAEDAWLSGVAINRKGTAEQPLVEHWNGSSWHRKVVPQRAARAFGQDNFPQLITASSASGVWTFSVTGRYLHLRGRTWTTGHLPVPEHARLLIGHVAGFSSCDVWAFGTLVKGSGGKAKYPYAARFNCRRWHAVLVPGAGALGQVSAISPHNMLALERPSVPGFGPAHIPAILHWNGTVWRTEHSQPQIPKGGTITALMTGHPVGAWIAGSIRNSKQGTSELAMHWNGHTWMTDSPHSAPSAQDFTIAGIAPDGRGGIWAISDSLFGTGRFWHFTHNTWSQPVHSPWLILGLVAVPGTKAIWAISENNNNSVGLVILHGSLNTHHQNPVRSPMPLRDQGKLPTVDLIAVGAILDFVLMTG